MFGSYLCVDHRGSFALVHQRKNQIIAVAQKMTDSGLFLNAEPCLVVAAAEVSAVGSAVSRCLDIYSTGAAHPQSWSDLEVALLRAAGVRSRIAFYREARLVNLGRQSDGCLRLVPTRNLGPKEGFVELAESESQVSGPWETQLSERRYFNRLRCAK